jgi:acyl-CoA thioester hydrolase
VTATDSAAAAPPEPSQFPVLVEHAAHYSDLDPSRRIGRDTLIRWFEDARVQLGREALQADLSDRAEGLVRLLLVAVRVDVLAPLRIAGDYRIGIGVTAIGRSSVTYRYAVFAGDECVATGASVSVTSGTTGRSRCPTTCASSWGATASTARPRGCPTGTSSGRARRTPSGSTCAPGSATSTPTGTSTTSGWPGGTSTGWPNCTSTCSATRSAGPSTGSRRAASLSPTSTRCITRASFQLRVGVVDIDDDVVRYACGLFDEGRCVGITEAAGTFRATDAQGEAVDLATTLEPFRLRG